MEHADPHKNRENKYMSIPKHHELRSFNCTSIEGLMVLLWWYLGSLRGGLVMPEEKTCDSVFWGGNEPGLQQL